MEVGATPDLLDVGLTNVLLTRLKRPGGMLPDDAGEPRPVVLLLVCGIVPNPVVLLLVCEVLPKPVVLLGRMVEDSVVRIFV